MKNIVIISLFTLALFSSCNERNELGEDYRPYVVSEDDETTATVVNQEVTAVEQGTTPISFTFVEEQNTATRSLVTRAQEEEAVGVFGFADTTPFVLGASPNLMDNQKVTYDYNSNTWSYSPTKYWPVGKEGTCYSSFIFYYPYAENKSNSYLTIDSKAPYLIHYSPSSPMDENAYLVYGSKLNTNENEDNGRVKFTVNYAHAEVVLQAMTAQETGDSKVTIGSVSLTGQLAHEGTFNLLDGQWSDVSTSQHTYQVTGYDINENLRDRGNLSAAQQPEGVPSYTTDITKQPFYFIPTDRYIELTITVNYFITTDDSSLPQGFSRIENRITKSGTIWLRKGYVSLIRLILGMTTMRVEITNESILGGDTAYDEYILSRRGDNRE